MKRWLHEPLLHFFLLGAVLFGAYGLLNRNGYDAPNEIVVSRGQVNALREQFERVWRRPATPVELQSLIDNWVRDEIFYREGLAMGLDRDDPIVRRRVGQKVQFIVDSAAPTAPSEQELQRWLDEHADTYRVEAVYSLRQIYFNPQQHGERFESVLQDAAARLKQGLSVTGDVTMLPETLANESAAEVIGLFGAGFEQALTSLPTGEWQGPIRSAFGVHFVEISAREPGRAATLAEVRESVERDLQQAHSEAASERYFQQLRSRYSVRIEDPTSGPTG